MKSLKLVLPTDRISDIWPKTHSKHDWDRLRQGNRKCKMLTRFRTHSCRTLLVDFTLSNTNNQLKCVLLTSYFLSVQVSFRYHCQLYSEWRRTNQKVRLLIPEAKESNSSQHSLLSTKLTKKSANESIVWDQMETEGDDNGVFYVRGLILTPAS